MKKERMFELMTELRDREFTLKECYMLFDAINWFIECRKDWIKSIGQNWESTERKSLDAARADLKRTLYADGLEYTIDEFITED